MMNKTPPEPSDRSNVGTRFVNWLDPPHRHQLSAA